MPSDSHGPAADLNTGRTDEFRSCLRDLLPAAAIRRCHRRPGLSKLPKQLLVLFSLYALLEMSGIVAPSLAIAASQAVSVPGTQQLRGEQGVLATWHEA